MTTEYTEISEADVPETIRFYAQGSAQGQICETEYGRPVQVAAGDAYTDGAPYMRYRDQSEGPAWTYYRRIGGPR